MPNIVATFDAGKPGRHLALNGHIDVFPVGDGEGWTCDPWAASWSTAASTYSPGACDRKCGTTASIFTFLYLRELCDELHGRLILSALSDEETFGPYGARYLFEHHPEEASGQANHTTRRGPPSIEVVRLPLPSGGGLCSFDV